MLEVETSCGKLTVGTGWRSSRRQVVNTNLTDHPKQVFGSVHRTHLLLGPHFDTRSGDKLLPDLCVLWPFEAV